MYLYQYEGTDSTWLGPTGQWRDVPFGSSTRQKMGLTEWSHTCYLETKLQLQKWTRCIIYIYFLKITQCCVTCWTDSVSLSTAGRGWGYISKFVSTSEHTVMKIYLYLFKSLLKKANLLRSTAAFVLNLATQRYTFATIWASLGMTVLHCRLLCRHTLRCPSVLELTVLLFWAHIPSPPNEFEQSARRLRDIANI